MGNQDLFSDETFRSFWNAELTSRRNIKEEIAPGYRCAARVGCIF